MQYRLIVLAAMAALVLPVRGAHAQTPALPRTEVQWWHLAFAQGRIHERWLYFLETQPRIGGDQSLLLLRSATGLSLTGDLSLWAGFAWITVDLNEGRFFQQLLYTPVLGPVRLMSRTRLEQRSLEGAAGVSHRARTLLRGALPLGGEKLWTAILWDEVFFNLNAVEGGPRAGFSQNRAFAGIGRKLSDAVTLEFGYLNVFVRTPSQPSDEMIHTLFTSTAFSFF